MKMKKQGKMKRVIKKIGKVLAGAVLVSSLMLGPGKAAAQKPKEKPKIGLNVKMGAAFDHVAKEPRALITLGSGFPLPMKMRFDARIGVATTLDGNVQWEELNTNLNIPIIGPVSMDVFGYNARHLAVNKFSVGGDVCVKLPFGAALVLFERIMDAGQLPITGIVRIDPTERLVLFIHGSWVTNKDAGALRGRLYFTPKGNLPTFGIDTLAIFNKNELLFVDTLASVEWKY